MRALLVVLSLSGGAVGGAALGGLVGHPVAGVAVGLLLGLAVGLLLSQVEAAETTDRAEATSWLWF